MKCFLWLLAGVQIFLNIYFLIKIFVLSDENRDLKWQIKFLMKYLMRKDTIKGRRKAI